MATSNCRLCAFLIVARQCLADAQHALALGYGFRNWKELKTRVEECPPPLRNTPSQHWYHGSASLLQFLRPGSSVTPVVELAKAFARRPSRIDILVHENDEENVRKVTLEDDGKRDGYLYEVEITDPATDLRANPESKMAPGEELLTTRGLRVRLIEQVSVAAGPAQKITEEAF